jgi:hypothetical protein
LLLSLKMNTSPTVKNFAEKTRELLRSHQTIDGPVYLCYETLYHGEFFKMAREIICSANVKARRFSESNSEFLFESNGRFVRISYRYVMDDRPFKFEIRFSDDIAEFGEHCDDVGVLHNKFK